MSQKRSGCSGGGCLTFLIGIVIGAALTLFSLFVWAVMRPADQTPLTNRLAPEDLDLEVTVSEAYLNRAVALNLEAHQEDDPLSVILDFHRAARVDAILEGFVRILGLDLLSPTLDAELSLGVDDGGLTVRIDRVGIGSLQFARDSLPEVAEPVLESVEEAIEQALNEQLVAVGYRVLQIETDEGSMTVGLRQQ